MQIIKKNMLNKADLSKARSGLEQDQPLEDRVRELVSISASIAGHCRPCFQYHFKRAQELNIPLREIEQAIAIARDISAAGDQHMLEFAQQIIEKSNKQ